MRIIGVERMGCEGYLTKIKLKCPRCGDIRYKENLETVLKEVEEMWKDWEDSMTEEQKQMVRKRNNPERLQAILDEEGYLMMFCPACRLLTTLQVMQKQQGIGG